MEQEELKELLFNHKEWMNKLCLVEDRDIANLVLYTESIFNKILQAYFNEEQIELINHWLQYPFSFEHLWLDLHQLDIEEDIE